MTAVLLRFASDGYLIFDGTYRYPRVAVSQGIEGLRRIELERGRSVTKRIVALKDGGHLVRKRRGDRIMLELTDRGRLTLLKSEIASSAKRTDRTCLLVVFDIPETHRSARASFRHLLRTCGFTRLQDSVWISDRSAERALAAWAKQAKVSDWIRFFSANAC